MSLRSTLKALPTVLKVASNEALAYRAEMIVWVLATTMPLVMMALWTAVAADAPVGRFGQKEFVAYFLASFVVRQLCGSWAAYQMNFEVRQGTLAMKLLRPISPLFLYAVEHLAYIPLRMLVAGPVAVLSLWLVGSAHLPKTLLSWWVVLAALLGGWLITFLSNVMVGCMSFYMQSSLKLMEMWWTLFFIFSGYLFPLALLPPWAQRAVAWLPFPYQLGFPVELLNSMHGQEETFRLLAIQWGWVALLWLLSSWAWRGGLRRYEAFGG